MVLNRRELLKGLTLAATGLLVPKISYPVEAKSIVPTYQRGMDGLGYIRLEFFDGEEVLFEVDESWVAITGTPRGFSLRFREVEYTSNRKCVVTSATVMTIGGDVIRKLKLQREIYMGFGDTARLSIEFNADFG